MSKVFSKIGKIWEGIPNGGSVTQHKLQLCLVHLVPTASHSCHCHFVLEKTQGINSHFVIHMFLQWSSLLLPPAVKVGKFLGLHYYLFHYLTCCCCCGHLYVDSWYACLDFFLQWRSCHMTHILCSCGRLLCFSSSCFSSSLATKHRWHRWRGVGHFQGASW